MPVYGAPNGDVVSGKFQTTDHIRALESARTADEYDRILKEKSHRDQAEINEKAGVTLGLFGPKGNWKPPPRK